MAPDLSYPPGAVSNAPAESSEAPEPELEDEPEAPATGWKARFKELFQKYRLRLAMASIAVFVVAVVIEIGGAVPREVLVAVPIGAGHEDVTEAQIEYSQEDEPVRDVTLRWPNGAPADVRDAVDLSPGDYDVRVLLIGRDGSTRRLHGRLRAPAEGVVRLALEGT